MRYEWLDGYLLGKPGAERDYKAEWGWLRYRVAERQFAAICTPGPQYGAYAREQVLLKCDPHLSELLRNVYPDIAPGFYSDKRTWISVFLDGQVPEELLRSLCDQSYDLVFGKLTKKRQREILNSEI